MLYMFFTAGSGNRGCEAIVRGTCELLQKREKIVYTAALQEDVKVELDKLAECRRMYEPVSKIRGIWNHLVCWLSYHYGTGKAQVKTIYKNVLQTIKKQDTCLVIGGDVYCYDKPYIYYRVNEILHKSKRILWGCSIEPGAIDEEMKRDLMSYDMIYARESITYDALIQHGIDTNVRLFPDPAFVMKCMDAPLPEGFEINNTIGINVSPLITGREGKDGITLENYEHLIDYIINHTDCKVALIPHVIWENGDDRKTLQLLYEKFFQTKRVIMVEALSAERIKGIISKCRFIVAARTHASIAAYSTCVPTLVVGYSVKARGIAKDIFGEYEHYTIPVQSLSKPDDLLHAFLWLWEREAEVREYLKVKIPQYTSRMSEIEKLVEEVEKDCKDEN